MKKRTANGHQPRLRKTAGTPGDGKDNRYPRRPGSDDPDFAAILDREPYSEAAGQAMINSILHDAQL